MYVSRSRMCARFVELMPVSFKCIFVENACDQYIYNNIVGSCVWVCVHCSFIFHFSLPHRRLTWRDSVQLIHFLIRFIKLWNDVWCVCVSMPVCVGEWACERLKHLSHRLVCLFVCVLHIRSYCGTCNLWACLRFYWIVLWVSQDKSQLICRLFGREWVRCAHSQWAGDRIPTFSFPCDNRKGHNYYRSEFRNSNKFESHVNRSDNSSISMATNGQQRNHLPFQRPTFAHMPITFRYTACLLYGVHTEFTTNAVFKSNQIK